MPPGVTFAAPTTKSFTVRYTFTFFLTLLALALTAQDGHAITVRIDGYDEPYLSLANNVMDKQYVVDTAYRTPAGEYVFSSDTAALPGGIYLVVLAPDNNYFQMVVGGGADQEFSLRTSVDDLSAARVEGSAENELFFDYLAFLDRQGKATKSVREALADTSLTEAARAPLLAQYDRVTAKVNAYQDQIIAEHPESFTATIIRSNRPNNPPPFADLAEDERRQAQYEWLLAHYFDPLDLTDDRLLRTPFLFERIDYYVSKLHVQHPDSVARAIDKVLARMNPDSELFKYYVVHFTNQAARSNYVGMDAVYVHMVDQYYTNGRAYWANEEQLATMRENADKTRPLLIGKPAPNLKMQRRDGRPVELYDIDANYTILYFWQFACGSCKKATPKMKAFYDKWKDRGVEIFSICTKQNEIDKCWEYIDDKEIGDWLHATDRYMRFYRDYDIRSTPSIFVLDADKKIVSKRIGAEQLDEVLTQLEKLKTAVQGTEKR